MKSVFVSIVCSLFFNFAHASLEVNVPFPPGGAVDIIGRHLGEYLNKNGYSNFNTNTPGAGGDIGLNHVITKKNNVIMVSGHGPIVFRSLEQKKENAYIKDTVVIGPIFSVPQGILSSSSSFKNINELVVSAKAEELPCGISNTQGTAELKKFNTLHGTKFVPVNYKGSAELRNDLVGNHIKCAYDTLNTHYSLIKSDKIRLLAITQLEKDFENVPLLSSTLSSGNSVSWYAMVLPKDSNLLLDTKLIDLLHRYTNDPTVHSEMKEKGFSPSKIDKNFNAFVEDTTKKYLPFFK
jgi:hypothetical protein